MSILFASRPPMIALRLLGSVDLRDASGHTLHTVLAQPKRLALLAYLRMASDGDFARRDVVAALFWPEVDHEHARSSLRVSLHALRRSLGDVIMARGQEEVGVDAASLWCDASAFERALEGRAWREALDLYRGDFLAGVHIHDASAELERWIEQARARYLGMATSAAWELSADEERRGNAAAALEWAKRAVAWNGTDEIGLRQLLRLHHKLGDRAGALAAFDAFCRRVRADLGVEPSAETLELVAALRSENHTAFAIPAAASKPEGWGRPVVSRRAASGWRPAAVVAAVVAMLGLSWSGFRRPAKVSAAAPASGSIAELANSVRGFFSVAGAPLPIRQGAAVSDALNDAVYVFGGASGTGLLNDLWFMDAPSRVSDVTWTRLDPHGNKPAPRAMHSAVYDSLVDRMIIFGGGLGYTSPCANDIWVLKNPSRRGGNPEWFEPQLTGSRPDPRGSHSAVWITRTRRMVVFGGHDCIARRMHDTWALVGTGEGDRLSWRQIATSGPAPDARSNHSAVYDEAGDRVVLFGGVKDRQIFDDVWELRPASSDSARWRRLQVRDADRPMLYGHSAAWDPASRQMIVFGGAGPDATSNSTWLLRFADENFVVWREVSSLTARPHPRLAFQAAYNSALDQLIILGGESGASLLHDAWVLTNASGRRFGDLPRR